ncbi:MAG: alkane 1-monooxygenase [Flavobacteriaceae bacterium]|nr:alkane 1-monooxygenase [Flavobacteriaceae bacterium]
MRDIKYLLAYTGPLSAIIALYFQGILSYSTLFYAFLMVPILELIIDNQQDDHEYNETEKQMRLKNKFFDLILYFNLPLTFGVLFWGFSEISSQSLEMYEIIGLTVSLGIVLSSNGINVAHELGHRKTTFEKTLSKLLLMPSLYMHFYIEHNFGHHKNVATNEDPATAKKNQSLYSFWITSVVGQYFNAWRIQLKLLKQNGSPFLSLKNDMLFYVFFQSIYLILIYVFFGTYTLLFAILVAIISFLLLETINYIEHYGLLRKKVNGRYEKVQTIHSWNSNHFVGRIVLYELTRHSDHHYRTSKKYQILENKNESPQLPFGYPTSMLISMIPPLWYKLMNPRLV